MNEYIRTGEDLLAKLENLTYPIYQEVFKLRTRSVSCTDRFEAAYLTYHQSSSEDKKTRLDKTARFLVGLRDMSSALSKFLPELSALFERILTEVEISWKKVPLDAYLECLLHSDLNLGIKSLDTVDEATYYPLTQLRAKNNRVRSVNRVKNDLVYIYPEDWNTPRERHKTEYDLSMAVLVGTKYLNHEESPEVPGFPFWFRFHRVIVNISAIRKYLITSGKPMKHVDMLEGFYRTGNRLLADFRMILRDFDIPGPVHSHEGPFDQRIGSCACSIDTCAQFVAKLLKAKEPRRASNAYLKICEYVPCYFLQ